MPSSFIIAVLLGLVFLITAVIGSFLRLKKLSFLPIYAAFTFTYGN
ncbi:hypothetical protein [Candidatus Enterovibrio escicola]|nr:hypothetical protein [Candidatus Enterovibrio escacola]